MRGGEICVPALGKVKSYAPVLGRQGQGGNDRDFAIRTGFLIEDGRFPSRRPGPADKRSHHEAGFVYENDMRVQCLGFFLILGQSTLTHLWMAASSRSRARRSGFCGLQPNDRSSLGM